MEASTQRALAEALLPLTSRIARWTLVLAGALSLGVADRAGAQSGVLGARYAGYLKIGTHAAPDGTPVTVIVARSATDFTVCARDATGKSLGRYELAIPAMSPCIAATHEEVPTLHLFVLSGENLGNQSNLASLDVPGSLGRTVRQDLKGTDIPHFDPTTAPQDGSLVGTRYYGRLFFGEAPAPAGTVVRVLAWRGKKLKNGSCGQGQVSDAEGDYWVDVDPLPRCIARTSEVAPMEHLLVVNGENVGSQSNLASLELPRSLGKTVRQDLKGAAIPGFDATNPPPGGRIVGVRYYGRLLLDQKPAPVGTQIHAVLKGASPGADCGSGAVTDAAGDYWLDVPLTATCIAPTSTAAPTRYVFLVGGQSVASARSFASLDLPRSLGAAVRKNLRRSGP